MQDSLRLVFIFVGIIAIGALLIHGFWSNKKSRYSADDKQPKAKTKVKQKRQTPATKELGTQAPVFDENGFDAVGVGKVRTVSHSIAKQDEPVNTSADTQSAIKQHQALLQAQKLNQASMLAQTVKAQIVPVSESAFSVEPEPSVSVPETAVVVQEALVLDEQECIDEATFVPPPKSLLKAEAEAETQSMASEPVLTAELQTEPHVEESAPDIHIETPLEPDVAAEVRIEPMIAAMPEEELEPEVEQKPEQDIEPEIQFEAPSAFEEKPTVAHHQEPTFEKAEPEAERALAEPKAKPASPQDVYIINVAAKDGDKLEGAKLLPQMLRLGFKFGEMDIFHRHEDAAGNGAVLFSIANMVKPGIFDPDNMEQFSTKGISLFFTVPCTGSASSHYKLMLQAAKKLAEALGAQLLDLHRNPMTEQSIRHTMNKVLEFERQLLLGGKRG